MEVKYRARLMINIGAPEVVLLFILNAVYPPSSDEVGCLSPCSKVVTSCYLIICYVVMTCPTNWNTVTAEPWIIDMGRF